jgi:DNA invertase Pin-like site-specific DNA recombinase
MTTTAPMRAAIYARCSTQEQTVDLQLDGLHDYAKVRGFAVVEEYVDEAVSGAKARRPALDQLLADAHRRRFDAVLVWKLDRLGRSLSHLIRVVDTLGSLGVDLVSLGDPGLDTSSPHGRLIFSVMGAVAEFERDLIRERTRAGMASARRRGSRVGRPRAHVPVGEARTLLAQGWTQTAVARELGVSRATLARALKRVSPEALESPRIPALH